LVADAPEESLDCELTFQSEQQIHSDHNGDIIDMIIARPKTSTISATFLKWSNQILSQCLSADTAVSCRIGIPSKFRTCLGAAARRICCKPDFEPV